jgi:hypothetical protein
MTRSRMAVLLLASAALAAGCEKSESGAALGPGVQPGAEKALPTLLSGAPK